MSARPVVRQPGPIPSRGGGGGRRSPPKRDLIPDLSVLNFAQLAGGNVPDALHSEFVSMPSVIRILSEFYGHFDGVAREPPSRINLVDGANIFHFEDTGGFFGASESTRPGNPRELDRDAVFLGVGRVDLIVVFSEATYFAFVKKKREEAGKVMQRLMTPDGYCFFVVPRIKTCKTSNDKYCLARKTKPGEQVMCSFVYQNSNRNTQYMHMYCEYDDILLFLLFRELKDGGDFSSVSIWAKYEKSRHPQVRLVSSDAKLQKDARKTWRMVFPKLMDLGDKLRLEIYRPNLKAYGLLR